MKIPRERLRAMDDSVDRLRAENAELKAQLERVSQERDRYKETAEIVTESQLNTQAANAAMVEALRKMACVHWDARKVLDSPPVAEFREQLERDRAENAELKAQAEKLCDAVVAGKEVIDADGEVIKSLEAVNAAMVEALLEIATATHWLFARNAAQRVLEQPLVAGLREQLECDRADADRWRDCLPGEAEEWFGRDSGEIGITEIRERLEEDRLKAFLLHSFLGANREQQIELIEDEGEGADGLTLEGLRKFVQGEVEREEA